MTAGRILESDIAQVRERNRIDEVIGEYGHVDLLKDPGGVLTGLCPFHEKDLRSFHVRPDHGTFHCFGCAEGGDVIAFVMKIDHLSFVEAVERLAARVGITLTYDKEPSVDPDTATQLRDIVRAAELAPRLLGEPVGGAVQVVLLDHAEDEAIDPNVAELATELLQLAEQRQAFRQCVDRLIRQTMRPAMAAVVLGGIGVVSAAWAYVAPSAHWLAQAGAIPIGAIAGYLIVRLAVAVDDLIGRKA